jgi:hypothetical protein
MIRGLSRAGLVVLGLLALFAISIIAPLMVGVVIGFFRASTPVPHPVRVIRYVDKP